MYEEKLKEYQDKLQEELKKTGVFYAFDNEQFEANKTHKDISDNKYINLGRGVYLHQLDKEKFENYCNNIKPKLTEEFLSNISIDDLIKNELINHECYYTGDITEVCEIVWNYYKKDMSLAEVRNKVQEIYIREKQRMNNAEEFVASEFSSLDESKRYNYMLLSRLKSDCDYFLGNEEATEKALWAENVEGQIAKMRELYNNFTEEEKPEWLSFDEIDDYEQRMQVKADKKEGVSVR